MGNEKITVKSQYTKNYITVNIPYRLEFSFSGHTLTGVREGLCSEIEGKPDERFFLEIPENIDTIANNAFSCLKALQNVCFKHRPYYLGSSIFFGCTGLETAVLAEGTEKIPLETFSGCEKLRMVQIPNSVKCINMDAFKNCTALKSVVLPPKLEVIEASAFWGCRSLEEINLPDSLNILEPDVFTNCIRLKTERLPAHLRKIGACAFANCISLEHIEIPKGIKSLPIGVFAGCRNLRHIVLPDSLEYISPYAFYRCDALDCVECRDLDRFAQALECTPARQSACITPRFPMELLNQFAGEVSGSVLTAMGHPWFDVDKKYRFLLSDEPGIIEVHSRSMDAEYPANALYDKFRINDALELV